MGQPNVFSRVLAAFNATSVAASQSPGAGLITRVSTTVILDTQRRLSFVSGGDDSGITFTVTGTNQAGFPITDTFAGGNTTASQSNLDFKTITNVTHSGSVAGTLTVGTNAVGSSLWQIINWNAVPTNFGFFIESRTGTTTFTLEYTLDDPNILPGSGGLNASGLAFPTAITLSTTIGTASLTTPFVAWRLTTNSGTGTLVIRGLQSGLGSP